MNLDAIDDVLANLDEVIVVSRAEPNRIGFFAAMYRKVTAEVRRAIVDGAFENPQRMVTLDAVFAQRFLDAWDHQRNGRRPTASWDLAFVASANARPLIVTHLLLGMNAHINLDLGIAAATAASEVNEPIGDLHEDFNRIGAILASLVAGFVEEVGALSPWIGLLDVLSFGREDRLIGFSIDVARDQSWAFAQSLAALEPADWNAAINARDKIAAEIGRRVLHPGFPINAGARIIRSRESKDIARCIDLLG